MQKRIAEEFVGDMCIGTTGRLGICTHIETFQDDTEKFRVAGFGLDGKGIWTSTHPYSLGTAVDFYYTLKKRFNGKLTWYG